MSDLKALARRLYDEAINVGNADMVDELTTDDFVEHEALPGMPTGRDAPKQMIHMANQGFSNFRMVVEEMSSEGNKVVVRLRMQGTHTGDFMGIPASGHEIDVPAIDILELRDGKVSAHWGVTDMAAMLEQMGVGGPPA